MDHQTSSPAEPSDHAQLRSCTRFPPDKSETWLLVGDERKSATVLDESFGGMGLMIESADAANVRVGDRLTVLEYGFPALGQVQWIRRDHETQKVCLGIRWTT
ncbi:MAG: PilZ domain-containing protein [Thermoguttaceae bacterium]